MSLPLDLAYETQRRLTAEDLRCAHKYVTEQLAAVRAKRRELITRRRELKRDEEMYMMEKRVLEEDFLELQR